MQSISKETILDMLDFVVMRTELAINCTQGVVRHHDFLLSNEGMNLFDATCMRLQTIGETMKKVDLPTEGRLLECYTDISWRDIFGLRNIISHDYLSVNPEIIFDIVKNELQPLLITLKKIISDLESGLYDDLFA